jgi:hypothetical protein
MDEDQESTETYRYTPNYDYSVLIDSKGWPRTKTLFVDFIDNNKLRERATRLPPLFTLRENDYKGLPSLKRIYLAYRDPTEYSFAMDLFNSYTHWIRLCESKFFQEHHEKWKLELEIALRSEGIRALRNMTGRNDSTGFNASKFLASKGWDPKTAATEKARKASDQKKHEKTLVDKALKTVDDDLARILG